MGKEYASEEAKEEEYTQVRTEEMKGYQLLMGASSGFCFLAAMIHVFIFRQALREGNTKQLFYSTALGITCVAVGALGVKLLCQI